MTQSCYCAKLDPFLSEKLINDDTQTSISSDKIKDCTSSQKTKHRLVLGKKQQNAKTIKRTIIQFICTAVLCLGFFISWQRFFQIGTLFSECPDNRVCKVKCYSHILSSVCGLEYDN